MATLCDNPLRTSHLSSAVTARTEEKERARSPLQDGWEAAVDDFSGAPYYYNPASDETRWDPPLKGGSASAPGSAAVTAALPSGWKALLDDDGSTFYHQPTTGETTWKKPAPAESEDGSNY